MNTGSIFRRSDLGFAVTIFLSAFLLFEVQPLISKCILPWFGGTPAVWTTCMLFFQSLLFAGYAYAHLSSHYLSPRTHGVVHVGLMGAALLLLPITPASTWKPAAGDDPTLSIVLLLAAHVGLPFFILSATGPLLQNWFSRTHNGASPYRLYALSNLGSLLALISYPFVVEPAVATTAQAGIWSWGFAVFVGFCAACAARMARPESAKGVVQEPRVSASGGGPLAITRAEVRAVPGRGSVGSGRAMQPAPPRFGTRLLWFTLAMTASVMLLATTNQVCQDVASVPFLWVLPLTLYLLSFILCFDSERWYSRRTFTLALGVSMATVCVVMLKGAGVSIIAQVLVYFSGLFFCAMVCHGELARLKPHPAYLTSFYLVIAAGGAAGGLFVGILAPLIFPSYLELHLGIVGSCVLTLVVFFRDRNWVFYGGRPRWAWATMILAVIGLSAALRVQAAEAFNQALTVSRNFYGVLRVTEERRNDPERHQFKLMHGRILHGLQFAAEDKHREPTAYYGRDSGVGLVLTHHHMHTSKRVGVVGLGVGTVATYARPGDTYRFYEINPAVVRLAERYFTYLRECPGTVDIVLGDARLSLEHEPPQQFDVLVLDAFSGDAIPTHLLTEEAFEVYLRHLQPDGVLAVHISNLYFDLRPVVTAACERCGFESTTVFSPDNEEHGTNACVWVLASRNPDSLDIPAVERSALHPETHRTLWTDDHSNLFEVLR